MIIKTSLAQYGKNESYCFISCKSINPLKLSATNSSLLGLPIYSMEISSIVVTSELTKMSNMLELFVLKSLTYVESLADDV